VGAGWVTQHHLAGWHQLRDRAHVLAIADPDRQQAALRAREYGIANVFDSAQRMLDEIELDAVDIAAPRQFHVPLVRRERRSLMANLSVHGRAPAASNRLTLIGTRGTIELEGDLLRCAGEQPCELRFDMAAGYLQSYAATITHFVDCLRDGRVFETAPADSLRTLGLVEAIYAPAAARVGDC